MTVDARKANSLKVSMEGYEKTILDEHKITGVASTPASNNLYIIDQNSEELNESDKRIFHTCSARLLYLAGRTRPEMQVVASFLCSRVTRPTRQDQYKLERALKYINGSPGKGIVFEKTDSLALRAFIDASHGVHHDGTGQHGAIFTLNLGPIYARSKKQKILCKSSTESELVALSDFSEKLEWFNDFLKEQNVKFKAAKVFQDNTSTISKIAQDEFSGKDRKLHFKKRRLLVKELVDEGVIKIKYLPTECMVADILTKPLQGELFKRLAIAMSNDELLCGGVSYYHKHDDNNNNK
jgi:hypothetical protein